MNTTILDMVGNTPVVRLQRMAQGLPAEVWVKLESRNPGGSLKDRIAIFMIEQAVKRGELAEGGLIIEPTSGNTGIGLAMVAAVRGMRIILTMPESMSTERKTLLRAYGAELVLTPAALGMSGAVAEAERLLAENAGAFMPSQFTNPDGPLAHFLSTGPEIAQQLSGIGAFTTGVGSGGTVSGVGRYLKQYCAPVCIVALEPASSAVLSGAPAGAHPIQGIGAGFVPSALDRSVVDEVLAVEGADAFETARRMMREEGISCGISSGANVWGALQLAAQQRFAGTKIVTVVCDSAERYLSTALFTD